MQVSCTAFTIYKVLGDSKQAMDKPWKTAFYLTYLPSQRVILSLNTFFEKVIQ